MGSNRWGDFEVEDTLVHGGLKSAHLHVSSTGDGSEGGVKVFGVVQEIKLESTEGRFPEKLSGWYRVEGWDRGAAGADGKKAALYVQAVVIVWGDPRGARLVSGNTRGRAPRPSKSDATNYQIRYYLAGIDTPPFVLKNARYKFITKGDPVRHEWIPFELDLRRDFKELWRVVPEGYQFIRILLEARFDNKPAGAEVSADVYYDDLHLGD